MSVGLGRIFLDPPVFLAPMAGISDRPFREIAERFGAGLVVSEMVASADMLHDKPSARTRASLGLGRARTAVQLAGREPAPMAEAARRLEAEGTPVIDINFGCPAKKVTGGLSGAALMREPARALRIIEAVVAAVAVPVTLKMRLGWDDDSRNAPAIARLAEAAGVRMLTVHGRTRCQFYAGRADWSAIRAVRDSVRIPVVANGDITDAATARAALARSGAQAVMVGRGARGRPWILGQIAAALAGRPAPAAPRGPELRALVAAHYDAMLAFYGRETGQKVARKHLGWYLDEAGAAPAFRAMLLRSEEPAAVLRALERPWPAAVPDEAAA
jgi:tRNA-dihydrouridine synthase B